MFISKEGSSRSPILLMLLSEPAADPPSSNRHGPLTERGRRSPSFSTNIALLTEGKSNRIDVANELGRNSVP